MEPDAKPVVDHQCLLNPKMKEVVRTEILKLLEVGIIYPIADSRWVSLVHCVPKKGGICSDQTSNSLISVHQCHLWISNADMHSTNGGFITE